MKRASVLVVLLALLGLTSPLLAQEKAAAPGAQAPASESAPLPFLNPAAPAPAAQCTSPKLFPDLGMTARECAQTCGGCCACAQSMGSRCIDWECC